MREKNGRCLGNLSFPLPCGILRALWTLLLLHHPSSTHPKPCSENAPEFFPNFYVICRWAKERKLFSPDLLLPPFLSLPFLVRRRKEKDTAEEYVNAITAVSHLAKGEEGRAI